MSMESEQEPEVVESTATEEEDWLPEASKQAVRRQPDYQRVDTVCDACQ